MQGIYCKVRSLKQVCVCHTVVSLVKLPVQYVFCWLLVMLLLVLLLLLFFSHHIMMVLRFKHVDKSLSTGYVTVYQNRIRSKAYRVQTEHLIAGVDKQWLNFCRRQRSSVTVGTKATLFRKKAVPLSVLGRDYYCCKLQTADVTTGYACDRHGRRECCRRWQYHTDIVVQNIKETFRWFRSVFQSPVQATTPRDTPTIPLVCLRTTLQLIHRYKNNSTLTRNVVCYTKWIRAF